MYRQNNQQDDLTIYTDGIIPTYKVIRGLHFTSTDPKIPLK